MDRFIGLLGAMIGVMLILFFVVAKYVGSTNSVAAPFGSCGQIEDVGSRNECLRSLASQNVDVTPCLEIEKTSVRDICLRNVALKSKDISICQQIMTPDIKRICLSDPG